MRFPLVVALYIGVGFSLVAYLARITKEVPEDWIETVRIVVIVWFGFIGFNLTIWRSTIAEHRLESMGRNHLEEQYRNASEMLKSKELFARLGAIDDLNQLAREHPDQFHVRVMRLYAAFVRNPVEGCERLAADGSVLGTEPPLPREDIQTIIVYVSVRSAEGRELECKGDYAPYVIDLQGADLRWVSFPHDACLDRVRLYRARLAGARLAGVDLSGVLGLTPEQLAETDVGSIPS